MSYKNTMKLFASNFALVWKQVVYFLICLIIFIPITYSVAKPILQILNDNGIGDRFDNIFSAMYLEETGIFSLVRIAKDIIILIGNNFSDIFGNVLLLLLFGFLLPFIFLQISSYNLSSIMYKKLSMNMNVGYLQNLINTLKNSVLYSLINIIFRLPFWFADILILELFLLISNTSIGIFFGLILVQTLFIIINAFKHTFFSNYTTICIEKDYSPIYAFFMAFPITVKYFWNMMATSIVVQLTILASNTFIALFTFFSGLILMIPATFVFLAIFYTVIYLNKTGQRYYMGNNYIYNPIHYSVKRDEYADKMLDPEEPIEEQYVTAITSLKKNKTKINKK